MGLERSVSQSPADQVGFRRRAGFWVGHPAHSRPGGSTVIQGLQSHQDRRFFYSVGGHPIKSDRHVAHGEIAYGVVEHGI